MLSIRYSKFCAPLITLVCLAIGSLVLSPVTANDDANVDAKSKPVRRYDPLSQSLQPVADDKIIVGKIYNHFCPKHNRYVWAYALP